MICRVFIHPDDSLAVLHPNGTLRLEQDDDTSFLDRLTKLTPLEGLPFIDVDAAELPPRADRARWHVRDNRVTVKEL